MSRGKTIKVPEGSLAREAPSQRAPETAPARPVVAPTLIDPTTGEPCAPVAQGWPQRAMKKREGMIDPTTGEPVKPIKQGWPT
jgi:hypothetical protein